MTTAQANDVKAIEDKFVNSLGSGASATEHLGAMMTSVVSSRDTTVLSRAINRALSKGDDAAANIVRFTTAQVFPKAKIKLAKDGKSAPTITIKGIDADEEALARLKDAVERRLSIRHATFRKVVQGEPKEEKTFDPKTWAERLAKKHDRAELDAMIAALQAARS